MPSVANDKVKKKLFSFETLLKNHKSDQKLNEKKKNDCLVIDNSKMFMDITNSFKLKGLSAKTLKSDYLNIKINQNEQKKNFFILRQYGDMKKKIVLECYKDDSLRKLKSIIDLDNVEQIDFNEKTNTICLSKSVNENCLLEGENKKITVDWLSVICKNCGFSEIKTDNEVLKMFDVSQKTLLNASQAETIQNKHEESKSNKKTSTEKKINQSETLTNKNKKIAGLAAYSVGSFDLCHGQLEKIFEKSNKNQHEQLYSSKDNFQMPKESYIDLKECLSGLDDNENVNQSQKAKTKTNFQSFNSLDENASLPNQYNDDYSVFDFDVSSQQKLPSSHSLKTLNRIEANKKELKSKEKSYQQNIKSPADVSHGYYNTAENIPNNDYINYTETFDSVYQNFDHDLNYVPLEVVENSKIFYTSEYNKKYLKENNSSVKTNKKAPSTNLFNLEKISSGYTAWDAERTQALKHTQTEFKRPI